ncbi:MAG TPA: hypothetical protein DCS21_06950 [Gammaproteobacteria bacterium]|nr:hypothetical protein [Gammaproteobacteria bacterium]
MRKLITAALATVLMTVSYLSPSTSQAAPLQEPASSDYRLLAIGAGAIVGVVTFNMLTYPLGSVPFVAGPLAGTPIDIALGSRLLATVTAGTGALLAHYAWIAKTAKTANLEPAPTQETGSSDALYPLVLTAGALAGVAAVNVLTYGVGSLPLVIGAETAAPIITPAAAAASRIFVITSGVIGAWMADSLYTRSQ